MCHARVSVCCAANTFPVARPDAYSATIGFTLTVNASFGVLANDTDAENATLTAVLVAGPTLGTLAGLNADGSFGYTAGSSAPNYTDTFTYKANDGNLNSSTTTVTISVAMRE
jgi:large repetitive protein